MKEKELYQKPEINEYEIDVRNQILDTSGEEPF